nr:group II intron maturase-specific domain-containing protein [Proteiniclasticum sp.]
MKRRVVPVVRYADDIVVFGRSKRAAERLMESSRKYLENNLKLMLNLEKSKAISIYSRKFKFLGFALGRNGKGNYIRVHRDSLAKARVKLKELTKRNQGKNVREVMEKTKVYIRGWLGYFHIADMKRIALEWDKWLRRRFRMYIWKQWKKPKTRVQNLQKLGIPKEQAYQWGNTRLGYWRIAGSAVLSRSITNEKLVRAGYYDIQARYELLGKRT